MLALWFAYLLIAEAVDTSSYAFDSDASWAIISTNLSNQLGDKKSMYQTFMEDCNMASKRKGEEPCDDSENHRIYMNAHQPRSMKNYTKSGFHKQKAPEVLFALLKKFWENNRHTKKKQVEWSYSTPLHNNWQVPTEMIHVGDVDLSMGGGASFVSNISNLLRPVLEEWSNATLTSSAVYGIRTYYNQSILIPHVDRLPRVISAIINVDQQVDEPWVLEVYGHDGKAHNITMEPGDMILYESHSVIHGRPFPLNGSYFANIFVHFEPVSEPPTQRTTAKSSAASLNSTLPPYLMDASSWKNEYLRQFPNGWTTLSDVNGLISNQDLHMLQYLAQHDKTALTRPIKHKTGWQPIHRAAQLGNGEILDLLIQEVGVDVNTPCYLPFGVTPITIVTEMLGKNDPLVDRLNELGGRPYHELLY